MTADIERVTQSRPPAGSSESSPGVSICARPTTRFCRSSFTTRFSPISVTYQCEPSGSTAVSCGFDFSVKPSCRRSTVAMSESAAGSMIETVAASWFAT